MSRYNPAHIRKMARELLDFIRYDGKWKYQSNGKLKIAFKTAMIDVDAIDIPNDPNGRLYWSDRIWQKINTAYNYEIRYEKINQYYKEFIEVFGEE